MTRFFQARGFEIKKSGGDGFVIAPKTYPLPEQGRKAVKIGHTSCARSGSELLPVYVKQLEKAFGVKREDILSGKKPPASTASKAVVPAGRTPAARKRATRRTPHKKK